MIPPVCAIAHYYCAFNVRLANDLAELAAATTDFFGANFGAL
jgi:hypothetical protein